MKLNYKVFGEGKSLLILHGLMGSLDNWQSLGKQFAEHRKVYLIDQRNHGKSGHSEDHNYPLMIEDLKEFMDDQQLEITDIIGHSMGGKTAMGFAVKYPFMVDRLIVVDIAPKTYPVHHDKILTGLSLVNFNVIHSRKEVEPILTPYIPEKGIRQFLMKNMYWVEKGKLDWKFNLTAIKKDIQLIGAGLTEGSYFSNPTLFIDGENSDYITEAEIDLIDEIFPRNELVTFEDCAHWLHAEKPQLFLETVEDFLN
jgi:esterase